jgi:hypothetical protein
MKNIAEILGVQSSSPKSRYEESFEQTAVNKSMKKSKNPIREYEIP